MVPFIDFLFSFFFFFCHEGRVEIELLDWYSVVTYSWNARKGRKGRDGKGWDGIEREGKGREGKVREGKGWEGMGRDGRGKQGLREESECQGKEGE